MYFIKYHLLKKRLRDRSVTVRESLPYLIAFIILSGLTDLIPAGERNFWDSIGDILNIVAIVGGVLYAYYKNGGAAGNDFFLKFILIGWVTCVRFVFIIIPAAFLIAYLGVKVGLLTLESGPYDLTLLLLAEIIFYRWIGRHIKDTISNNIEEDGHEL